MTIRLPDSFIPRRPTKTALALLLFLLPTTLDATSILCIRTPDSVTLTTDSKAAVAGGSQNVCKIFRLGRLYFAIAGIDHDSARGFYPKNIVAANFSESGSFSEAVLRVQQAMQIGLEKEMKRLQTENGDQFAAAVAREGGALEIVFAEFRDGIPQMGSFGLTYSGNRSTATQTFCPGDCADGSYLSHLGHYDSGEQRLEAFRQSGEKLDPVALSREIVQGEIATNPAEVGPPIITLQLNKNGARWISNGSSCPVNVIAKPTH